MSAGSLYQVYNKARKLQVLAKSIVPVSDDKEIVDQISAGVPDQSTDDTSDLEPKDINIGQLSLK